MSTPPSLAGAGLVFVGGFAGTLARYAVSLGLPVTDGGWPLGTLAVNITGSFLLAYLLERLTAMGPETRDRRRFRLLIGSGVLSGYTTYSTLAVETERLLATGHSAVAGGYVVLTLAGGLMAAVAGYALATRSRPPGDQATIPETEGSGW